MNYETDHQLVKSAAQAAGVEAYRLDLPASHPSRFDPLGSNGDAFWLFVALGLQVRVVAGQWTEAASPLWEVSKGQVHGADAFAATRRAIVRAAAAIKPAQSAKEVGR